MPLNSFMFIIMKGSLSSKNMQYLHVLQGKKKGGVNAQVQEAANEILVRPVSEQLFFPTDFKSLFKAKK